MDKNIHDIKRKNLDDALNNATRRQRDDLNSGTYAERQKRKIMKLLERDDFRNGSISVKVSGGNALIGRANELFLGEKGREHEARFREDDVLIKKGKNDVRFTLLLTNKFKMEKADGTVQEIPEEKAEELAKELYDQVQDRKTDALNKVREEAIEKGIIKGYTDEEISELAFEQMMSEDAFRKQLHKSDTLKIAKAQERGELGKVDPIATKLGSFVTENGDTISPMYDLRIEINGKDVVTDAKSRTPQGMLVDEKAATDNALQQLGRVGDFAPTVLDKGGDFLAEQATRGAAFRASSIPMKAAGDVLTGHQKEVNNANQMISSALSRAIAMLNQGVQMR